MPWWGWLIIGIFLMGAEILGVDAAFYLIFIGSAAIIVGLLGLFGLTLPIWGQWLLFSVMAFALMVLFRRKLYNKIRPGGTGYEDTLIGEIVEVRGDTLPGGQARVSLRGSEWTAINAGGSPLGAGSQATVVAADGTTLRIEALPGPSSQHGK